jgi:hypothetical protein
MKTDIVFADKKQTVEYWEDGHKYRLSMRAKLHSLSGQYPYFSMTGEQYRQTNGRGHWAEDSFGCLHDDIAQHFPKYEKFIKWHLVSIEEPMHYISNSLYWAGLQGWTDGKKASPPNWEYFVSTAKWGEVAGDENIPVKCLMGRGNKKNIVNRVKSYILTHILKKRAKALQREFYNAMRELFGTDWEQPVEQFLLSKIGE